MSADSVAPWEAWPVGALVAAAGLNTALWYAGAAMPEPVRWLLPWLITAAAVASVIAIDGSLVATIAGMRAGRRSRWSVVNIIVTAAFTGLAALAAHTLPTIGPWLHGLFALTIVSYAMHLAQPRQDVAASLTAKAAALDKLLAEHAANVAAWNAESDREAAAQRQALTEQATAIDKAWAELYTREAAMTKVETVEYVEVASARLSWAEFAQIVDTARQRESVSVSSLRRLVAGKGGE